MFGDESYARFREQLGSWLPDDEELDDEYFEEEVPRTVKRVPLSALKDWFVPCISLVKKGQVPKAKIIAMKSRLDEEGDRLMPVDVVVQAFRDGLDVTTAEAEEILAAIVAVARGAATSSREDEDEEDPRVATKTSGDERRDRRGRRINKPFGVKPEYEAPERDSLGRRVNKPNDPRRR